MKPFLYAGAALMIGASIYGFVDYGKSQNNSQFKTMYSSEISKTETVLADGVGGTFSKELVKEETPEMELKKEIAEVKKPAKKSPAKKQTVKKKKKLNYKQFSRAPLREEEIMELDNIEQ